MAIRITPEGDKYIAEVTPPDGQWRTPYPMSVEELAVALKNIGCGRKASGDAFQEALLQSYRPMADEFSPQIRAALNRERDVPRQEPFSEAWLAYALYYYSRPLSLWEVLESADAINHLIPNPDEIAWAFLNLRKRGWLVVEGELYGLTPEGRRAIDAIVAQGHAPRPVLSLEEWITAHPPPSNE